MESSCDQSVKRTCAESLVGYNPKYINKIGAYKEEVYKLLEEQKRSGPKASKVTETQEMLNKAIACKANRDLNRLVKLSRSKPKVFKDFFEVLKSEISNVAQS